MSYLRGRGVIALIALLATALGSLTGYAFVLKDRLLSLEMQVGDLRFENLRLRMELESAYSIRDSLARELEELRRNLTYYELEVHYLRSQLASLQDELAKLSAKLRAYSDAYRNLRDRVNARWNESAVRLFITPEDVLVRAAVYSIVGVEPDTSEERYWAAVRLLYTWVVSNVRYRHDGIYPILPEDPSGPLRFIANSWQFPNETLRYREGDCDDMALLLASLILSYSRRYPVEVVIIASSTSAHAAVQVYVPGGMIAILDPAGRYYTSDEQGNLVAKDVAVEVINWLNYWRPRMGDDVGVYRVFSQGIDVRFRSTVEYLAWMYYRSAG